MVYSNRFVMCVLIKGVPQEELANGTVKIPFGEYSLRFRNKNSRCAVVQIYIDGENVSSGGYIIGANSYIDIKRHSDVDRAFKFVALDSPEAIEFGKNGDNSKKEKGTIEARFFLEKERYVAPQPLVIEKHIHHYKPNPWVQPYKPCWMDGTISTPSNEPYATYSNCCSFSEPELEREIKTCGIELPPTPVKDGCTVEGFATGQNFYKVDIYIEDTYTSVKIFLQGYEEDKPKLNISKTNYCDKCGSKFVRKSSKFCHVCGNKLQ